MASTMVVMTALTLRDGPVDAPVTFLLAHGAGAPMDSPFMQSVAEGLAERQWAVVRFEFPYMQRTRLTGKKAAPDRMPVLEACFREQVQALSGCSKLIVGGKSMGGRVASQLLDDLATSAPVVAGVCLGYPFHPPGKPERQRTEHLRILQVPLLVLQGERDPFGNVQEVEGYGLPSSVMLEWIPDGDHSLKPRKRSGVSAEANLDRAVQRMDVFARQLQG